MSTGTIRRTGARPRRTSRLAPYAVAAIASSQPGDGSMPPAAVCAISQCGRRLRCGESCGQAGPGAGHLAQDQHPLMMPDGFPTHARLGQRQRRPSPCRMPGLQGLQARRTAGTAGIADLRQSLQGGDGPHGQGASRLEGIHEWGRCVITDDELVNSRFPVVIESIGHELGRTDDVGVVVDRLAVSEHAKYLSVQPADGGRARPAATHASSRISFLRWNSSGAAHVCQASA